MKEITLGLTKKQKRYLNVYAEIFNDFTFTKEDKTVTFFAEMDTIQQICDYTGVEQDEAVSTNRIGINVEITFFDCEDIMNFIEEIKSVDVDPEWDILLDDEIYGDCD